MVLFFLLHMHLVKETFPKFPSVLHVNLANYTLIDKAIKGHFCEMIGLEPCYTKNCHAQAFCSFSHGNYMQESRRYKYIQQHVLCLLLQQCLKGLGSICKNSAILEQMCTLGGINNPTIMTELQQEQKSVLSI